MRQLQHLTRDARLLFATRFVRLFAYGSLSVVLVFYLVGVGLTESQTGLLLTLTLVGDTVVSLFLTTRADRIGRRRMLIAGAGLMAAAGLGTRSPGEDAGSESEVLEAVQVALDLGNNIDAVDNNGETAMHSAAYKNLPAVVKLLAAKGAKREIWDKPNSHGWTPLTIAEGHRFGNFKPSPDTIAVLRKIMLAEGASIEIDYQVPGTKREK